MICFLHEQVVMEQLFQFIVNHWPLWLLLVIVIAAIFHTEMKGQVYGVPLITSQTLTDYLNHKNAVVLDIRAKDEFKAGHILGSINIPEDEVDNNLKRLQKYRKKPLIIVCAKGFQSPRVGSKLKKEKFEHIFALRGGIEVWQSDNLPLEI
jgi:rhodanese-related sulfurtransferase